MRGARRCSISTMVIFAIGREREREKVELAR